MGRGGAFDDGQNEHGAGEEGAAASTVAAESGRPTEKESADSVW